MLTRSDRFGLALCLAAGWLMFASTFPEALLWAMFALGLVLFVAPLAREVTR